MANIRKECIRGEERKVISLFSRVFVSFLLRFCAFLAVLYHDFLSCAIFFFNLNGGESETFVPLLALRIDRRLAARLFLTTFVHTLLYIGTRVSGAFYFENSSCKHS